jgi:hypothetical protein
MVVCYGIANTIIFANGPFHVFEKMHRIAEKIHPQLEEMLSCFICSGWWLGFLFSALNLLVFPMIALTPMMMVGLPIQYWYVTVFLDGAFVSGSNWLINIIENYFETNSPNNG